MGLEEDYLVIAPRGCVLNGGPMVPIKKGLILLCSDGLEDLKGNCSGLYVHKGQFESSQLDFIENGAGIVMII